MRPILISLIFTLSLTGCTTSRGPKLIPAEFGGSRATATSGEGDTCSSAEYFDPTAFALQAAALVEDGRLGEAVQICTARASEVPGPGPATALASIMSRGPVTPEDFGQAAPLFCRQPGQEGHQHQRNPGKAGIQPEQNGRCDQHQYDRAPDLDDVPPES